MWKRLIFDNKIASTNKMLLLILEVRVYICDVVHTGIRQCRPSGYPLRIAHIQHYDRRQPPHRFASHRGWRRWHNDVFCPFWFPRKWFCTRLKQSRQMPVESIESIEMLKNVDYSIVNVRYWFSSHCFEFDQFVFMVFWTRERRNKKTNVKWKAVIPQIQKTQFCKKYNNYTYLH